MTEFKIIAKTFQGLEEVLAKELINLGANNVEIGRRMVAFTGDKEMLYKANFCTRTAVKILKPIKEFKATDADEVYEVVKGMDWEQWMDVKNTFLVDAVIFSENFRHSKFVAYRVKDAIADYWREKTGDRPNVGISNPDIRINVHIAENDVTISLDSSGESLHQRGYKTATVPAPLNEVLAAGLIMLTGWDGECDLIDPFCGSGTILIEAALIALNVYPGVFRKEYAFEKWKDFDADLFDRIYNDDSQERALHVHVFLPVNLLGCFIHLIGILCLKLLDGFQYLHGCTCTEVCLVEHLLVTRESHHSPTNLNVVGAQIDQFFCKDFLQSLEGLCDYLKFSHISFKLKTKN